MRGGRGLRLLVTACMHTRVAPLLMPATAPKWRGALRKSFQANGGLLYKTNFLSPATYEDVRNECRSLRRHFKRELDSIATGRLGCCLDSRSQAYLNLMTDDISTALSGVTGLTLFAFADTYVSRPPYCTHGLRAVRTGGAGQLAFGRHAPYVPPYTYLPWACRTVRTAYRGTAGLLP